METRASVGPHMIHARAEEKVKAGSTYLRILTGLSGENSSLKSSRSSSELRRDPGTDCAANPLPCAERAEGGEASWEPARLPRGVVKPGLMADILKRFGRENDEGKPVLFAYSGGVVG